MCKIFAHIDYKKLKITLLQVKYVKNPEIFNISDEYVKGDNK